MPQRGAGKAGSSSRIAECDTRFQWYWLGGEQELPVTRDRWKRYDASLSDHLYASFLAMQNEGRQDGLVLDLATVTDPPMEYQVWRAMPMEVLNPNEPELLGKRAIAGYSKDIWEVPESQLPASIRFGKVVTGFYQIRTGHSTLLEQLNGYLADPSGPPNPLQDTPRRRVVILIEIEQPKYLFETNRFCNQCPSKTGAKPEAGTGDNVLQAGWYWLAGEQKLPVTRDQWKRYDAPVSDHLTASFNEMQLKGRQEGFVLDLATVTDPPMEYQVWRAMPMEVLNPNEPELLGKRAIAGYSKDIWEVPESQLPLAVQFGKVVTGFYQIRTGHSTLLGQLNGYLADPSGPPNPLQDTPRRRVVILIEIEQPKVRFEKVNRFAHWLTSAVQAICGGSSPTSGVWSAAMITSALTLGWKGSR